MSEMRKKLSNGKKRHRRTYLPKEIRREMIAHTAMPIFAEKGFRGTTVEDICAACGIAPRTFYINFKNKKVLFELVVADIREKFSTIVRETIHENKPTIHNGEEVDQNEAYNFIRQKNYNIFKMVKENRDLLVILFREASLIGFNVYHFLKTIIDSMLGLVRTEQNVLQALGLVNDIDSRYSSQVIVGGMLLSIFYEIIEGDCDDIEQLADMTTKLQFYGFVVPS